MAFYNFRATPHGQNQWRTPCGAPSAFFKTSAPLLYLCECLRLGPCTGVMLLTSLTTHSITKPVLICSLSKNHKSIRHTFVFKHMNVLPRELAWPKQVARTTRTSPLDKDYSKAKTRFWNHKYTFYSVWSFQIHVQQDLFEHKLGWLQCHHIQH